MFSLSPFILLILFIKHCVFNDFQFFLIFIFKSTRELHTIFLLFPYFIHSSPYMFWVDYQISRIFFYRYISHINKTIPTYFLTKSFCGVPKQVSYLTKYTHSSICSLQIKRSRILMLAWFPLCLRMI